MRVNRAFGWRHLLVKISVKLFMCNVKDVFVGFATVPGFVALTASGGSPYLQVSDFIYRTASLIPNQSRDVT
jgi:hypothetical protein